MDRIFSGTAIFLEHEGAGRDPDNSFAGGYAKGAGNAAKFCVER